jgi:hypothetical protein
VLKSILNKAFDQYVFDRVDTIFNTTAADDAKYYKAVTEVDSILSQLMIIARELEEQRPELIRLVRDMESATTLESGLAAEIAYREGMRDNHSVRREFVEFIRKQTS